MRELAANLVFAIPIALVPAGCVTFTPYWQGNERLQRGDYQGAVEALTQAIEKDPLHYPAYLNRGVAYEKLREPDKALQDYTRAIELVPHFGRAYHYRGHVYADLGQFERAIAEYDQALKYADGYMVVDTHGVVLSVNKAAVHYDRGNSLYHLRRYEQAIVSYDNAVSLASSFAAAYNNRGVSYLELGDKKAACADRSRACELGDKGSCKWIQENC